MLKPALLAFLLIVPQVAQAADLPYRHRPYRHAAGHRLVDAGPVIRCTTTDWGLFSYANCGQSFDPFSAAAGR